MKERLPGVSVVICCHNGASRLPQTLACLKAQKAVPAPWEVLLIDNASTDGSADVARDCWREGPAPLRVICEERLGTRYARERGFAEASYEFVGFVDDDNWVAKDWVTVAFEIMCSDENLGAVSSIRIPALEKPAPPWFDRYHGPYAILTKEEFEGTLNAPRYLPTAGLCVRIQAWQELMRSGFRAQVPGRVGGDLSGGEDTELTVALRFCGWKLRVDPRLQMQHYLPKHRLNWMYLRRLMRNIDASTVLLDSYTEHSLSLRPSLRRWASDWWAYQLARALLKLARRPGAVLSAMVSVAESRHDVIELERVFGRSIGLLRTRGRYRAARRMVRTASWRRLEQPKLYLKAPNRGLESRALP